jgi:hypothetical protein
MKMEYWNDGILGKMRDGKDGLLEYWVKMQRKQEKRNAP